MSHELTALEASARLGIKRATLYAYVSRGLLQRHMAMDGRTSLFDSDEVDAFRSDRRRRTEGELDTVITTSLTRVRDGDLSIRGTNLIELVDADTDYESIVDLLWSGGSASWHRPGVADAAVARAQAALPTDASRLERLRVTTVVVSATDPLRLDLTPSSVRSAGTALIRAMVVGLPLVGRDITGSRLADRLWPRLTSRRASVQRRSALNAALALLADHGLAASTFGVRVAASVRADPYSVVTTGLGIVGGSLHGAASGAVHELLDQADRSGNVGQAVGEAHRHYGRNPGFGHTIYRSEDPRYHVLMARVTSAWSEDPRLVTVHAVRDLIGERTSAMANVDLALGSLTWLAGMDRDAGEAIFAIARTAGWIAHALEEYEEEPLRFRPQARYTGVQSGYQSETSA